MNPDKTKVITPKRKRIPALAAFTLGSLGAPKQTEHACINAGKNVNVINIFFSGFIINLIF